MPPGSTPTTSAAGSARARRTAARWVATAPRAETARRSAPTRRAPPRSRQRPPSAEPPVAVARETARRRDPRDRGRKLLPAESSGPRARTSTARGRQCWLLWTQHAACAVVGPLPRADHPRGVLLVYRIAPWSHCIGHQSALANGATA